MTCLVKAALLAPAYLSVAWTLMVSYQIFTQTAVKTVVTFMNGSFPFLGGWLDSRIDMVIFIYAFAWVFVLSSIIPSLILGRERSVFVQFIVCLAITLTAFVLLDTLDLSRFIVSNPYTQLFTNIFFAAFYLSIPYLLMISIDVVSRRKKRDQKTRVKKLTDEYFNRG